MTTEKPQLIIVTLTKGRPVTSFDAGVASLKSRLDQGSVRPEWAIPRVEDFEDGWVIAVDPSLAASGLVVLRSHNRTVEVLAAVVLQGKVAEEAQGHELNLSRSVDLYEEFHAHFNDISEKYGHGWVVVHEAPPTGGGKRGSLYRPESALMAAQSLRIACLRTGIPVAPMVNVQDHHYLCAGQRLCSKQQAHKVFQTWGPSVVTGWSLITNEAKRDALAVGLYHLWRG